MTPDEAIEGARAGKLLPVYLVSGDEPWLVERVVAAVRAQALAGAPVEFNEDRMTAGETDVDRVLGAVRLLPMMAKTRFVLVRQLDRWDTARAEGDDAGARKSKREGALDRLAEYAEAPVASSCLLLVGGKLDGRRKLVTLAKKKGFFVACDPVARHALPAWIAREAKARGHAIDGETAGMLAEMAGPELGQVADAVERLGLYVGPGARITEEAVSVCVMRTRASQIWDLVGALAKRDVGASLRIVADAFDPRDGGGLKIVGAVARSVRQLLRFEAATREGLSPAEAASRADAPPFRARELAAQVKSLSRVELERWLAVLAHADLELKGSRRPALATVEAMVVELSAGGARARAASA